MADYSIYTNYVNEILQTGDLSSFKSNPNYTYVLEHVSYEQGLQYYECIKQSTNISENSIRVFAGMNDAIGSPTQYKYGSITLSPTCLRYIWQSHLILTHFANKSNNQPIDIVEIGGGYGGLCLAIHTLSKYYPVNIHSYTIIDLDAPRRLQKLYLSHFNLTYPIDFVDASTYGEEIAKQGLFLISNYCFSELDSVFQAKYINHLFHKVSHGFIAWNHIPLYDFGFAFEDINEVPNTGGKYNRYVFF
jgi:hypothetical protein